MPPYYPYGGGGP